MLPPRDYNGRSRREKKGLKKRKCALSALFTTLTCPAHAAQHATAVDTAADPQLLQPLLNKKEKVFGLDVNGIQH